MVVGVCSELLGRLHAWSAGRLGAYAEPSAAVDLFRTMEMRR
jgi:hypothetical protein